MKVNNGQFVVLARWDDERTWEMEFESETFEGAIGAVTLDMQKHIERTESAGCPKRHHVIAYVVGISEATPEADGKREVSMRVEVSK